MSVTGLPADVEQKLSSLTVALQNAAGDNLVSLILFGSAARGRYHPESSDLNILIVLNDASAASLRGIAPILAGAALDLRADPFLLTTTEFQRAAEAFPTKFIEIRNYHISLKGPDPFATLVVSNRHALGRIEQELRNIEMRLRRRYVTSPQSPELLASALSQIVVPLTVALDALMEVKGRSSLPAQPVTRAALLMEAAEELELDEATLKTLPLLRSRDGAVPPPPAESIDALFASVLKTIGQAAAKAAELMREAS